MSHESCYCKKCLNTPSSEFGSVNYKRNIILHGAEKSKETTRALCQFNVCSNLLIRSNTLSVNNIHCYSACVEMVLKR